ncbi:MAG: LAGLIDADG family homing endonuclease [bacterium]|nr:LAGLIDADG family homing endonuclease [bacterium]
MKPLKKTNCTWSSKFAYVIGLIASDGNLSSDGRHVIFTSKDEELALLFKRYTKHKGKISKKSRGGSNEKNYFYVQIGDVNFYKFLLSIGLTQRKSHTIGKLDIPKKFFYDFLRGCIDGDGSIGIFRHPQSKYPQFKIRLVSASKQFLEWVQGITNRDGIKGFFTISKTIHVLAYAKNDSIKLSNLIYYSGYPPSLSRKSSVAKKFIL